jgi:S1-C subfamily serine protease
MSSPKPPVDPALFAVFGRPGQVNGSFAPRAWRPPEPVGNGQVVPEMLVDAFGRPSPDALGLQRPPAAGDRAEAGTGDGGAGRSDPWRDPDTSVSLGEPAVGREELAGKARRPAEQFTLRQALFEHRLRPSTLAGLALVALIIGAVGGLVGSLLSHAVPLSTTDPAYRIAAVDSVIQREPGSVSDIAGRVVPTVVSLEVRIGDVGDTGSGVVFDRSGYLLTNNHVVSIAATDKNATLTVVFNDGKGTRVPGSIVGRDPQSDLAVVKVDAANLAVAQLGNSDKVAVGDSVIAIGSPLGLQGTVTTGILSAVNRPVRLAAEGTDTNAVIDALQTDAAVNPGNSGGPLVDAAGAVIGINTAIRTLGESQTSGSIGLGFAIPINDARAIAEEIIRSGRVEHPSLGVNARSATDGTTDGAQVQNVRSGGPAANAGIVEGDVIIQVGKRSVGNADELVVAQQEHKVGETVPVTLLRDGRRTTVQVTLGAG